MYVYEIMIHSRFYPTMAPLWKLCANGRVTEVKAALAKGVDVSEETEEMKLP